MMKIGIDINGVLRDTIGKFTQLYEKHLIESSEESFMGNTYELDLSGNTELIEVESNNFEYKKVSDVDSLELDKHFAFKSKEEFFSFMYEDYAMELFGHAPSTEMTTFNILNDLYYELREENEMMVVSSEIGKSKPSSLFFLSKFGCLIEKVIFFSEITKNNMWNEVDVLLTADPILLLEKPVDKIVVKFNTIYNKHIDSEYEISSLSDFGELIKTLKQNV
jgi:hypothetical protein